MTPSDVIRAQLLAARASIDAALALMSAPEPEAVPEVCTHPEAKRTPQPVGGDPGQYMCRACLTIVSGKETTDGA